MAEQVKTKVTTDAEQGSLPEGIDFEQYFQTQLQFYPAFLSTIEKGMKKMKAKDLREVIIASLQLPVNDLVVPWINPKTQMPYKEKENSNILFGMLQEAFKVKTNFSVVYAAKKAQEAKEVEQSTDNNTDNDVNTKE